MRLSMKTLVSSVAAIAVGSGLMLVAPSAQAATASPASAVSQTRTAAAASALTAPVTGSFTDSSGGQGIFAGTFTPTKFAPSGQQVLATGTLTGTLTDSSGTALGTVTKTVSTPLVASTSSQASPAAVPAVGCQILDLRLQPLDLNLLGLTVHLDTVHLNITAVPGAGNLLGNLLCAVAGLLDGGSLGSLGAQLSALLNQILAILNAL
jgi:hypothetical protein